MGLLGVTPLQNVNKIVNATQLDFDLSSVANAIRTKKGITKSLSFPTEFCEEINSMATAGNEQPIDDVTFVDYDGNVCYTYTADEFLALTELPPNPSHEGLVAQGWNWTLAGAKTYVDESGCLCIGQNYTTDSGDTRIYISIPEYFLDCPMDIGFYTSVKNGVTIDWGDGYTTITDGNANTFKNYTHIYENAGQYVIKLRCTEGTYILGYNGSNTSIFYQSGYVAHSTSAKFVKKVEIGNNCTQIYRQGFQNCSKLTAISIPITLTAFGGSGVNGLVFTNCVGLSCMVFPRESTVYGSNNFSGCFTIKFISYGEDMTMPATYNENNNLKGLCMFTTPSLAATSQDFCSYAYALEKVAVPGTYTTYYTHFIRDCHLIRKFVVPASVTTINDYSFTNDYLKEFHLRPTTPPTIANTRGMPNMSAFNGVIYVPYSSDHSVLEAYKTATNWSSFADYIQEEPEGVGNK